VYDNISGRRYSTICFDVPIYRHSSPAISQGSKQRAYQQGNPHYTAQHREAHQTTCDCPLSPVPFHYKFYGQKKKATCDVTALEVNLFFPRGLYYSPPCQLTSGVAFNILQWLNYVFAAWSHLLGRFSKFLLKQVVGLLRWGIRPS
jgi:hypothetical protein